MTIRQNALASCRLNRHKIGENKLTSSRYRLKSQIGSTITTRSGTDAVVRSEGPAAAVTVVNCRAKCRNVIQRNAVHIQKRSTFSNHNGRSRHTRQPTYFAYCASSPFTDSRTLVADGCRICRSANDQGHSLCAHALTRLRFVSRQRQGSAGRAHGRDADSVVRRSVHKAVNRMPQVTSCIWPDSGRLWPAEAVQALSIYSSNTTSAGFTTRTTTL